MVPGPAPPVSHSSPGPSHSLPSPRRLPPPPTPSPPSPCGSSWDSIYVRPREAKKKIASQEFLAQLKKKKKMSPGHPSSRCKRMRTTTCPGIFGLPEHDLVFSTVLQLQGLLHLLQDLHNPKIEASFSSCQGQGGEG